MNGFEPVKECIYQYTDAGQWGVQWDEEIIRCRDCENFESDYSDGAMFGASVCWGWGDNGHDYPCFTHPDGFCHKGVRRAACDVAHHHAPTVEDVLREFADEFNRDDTELCDDEIIERFADRIKEVLRDE